MTRHVSVEASTCGGADASILAQHLDSRLSLADSLRMAARVRLAVIPSADEALCNLGMFTFVALYFLSTGGRHLSAVAEILRLIERLEELQTKLRGIISSPHLAMSLLYDVSRR